MRIYWIERVLHEMHAYLRTEPPEERRTFVRKYESCAASLTKYSRSRENDNNHRAMLDYIGKSKLEVTYVTI